jgi:hypothetical protein
MAIRKAGKRGTQADGSGVERAERAQVHAPLVDKVDRNRAGAKAEKIADLTGGDDHCDPSGETGDHRHRHIAHQPADTRVAGDDQDHTRHQGREQKTVKAVQGNDAGDDDDEGACGPSDLDTRATQRGNQESSDDRRHQSLARARSAGDAERHGERQSDDRDGEAGERVGAQIGAAVSLAKYSDEFRSETFGKLHST